MPKSDHYLSVTIQGRRDHWVRRRNYLKRVQRDEFSQRYLQVAGAALFLAKKKPSIRIAKNQDVTYPEGRAGNGLCVLIEHPATDYVFGKLEIWVWTRSRLAMRHHGAAVSGELYRSVRSHIAGSIHLKVAKRLQTHMEQ